MAHPGLTVRTMPYLISRLMDRENELWRAHKGIVQVEKNKFKIQ